MYLEQDRDGLAVVENTVMTGLKITLNGEDINVSKLETIVSKDAVVLKGEALRQGTGSIIIGEGGWYIINLYIVLLFRRDQADLSFRMILWME